MTGVFLILALAAAPRTGVREIDRGTASFGDLRYRDCVSSLKKAQGKKDLTQEQAAVLLEYLGYCHAALGDAGDAVRAFSQLLGLNPEWRLPDDVSPKIEALAERARAQIRPKRKTPPPPPEAEPPEPARALTPQRREPDSPRPRAPDAAPPEPELPRVATVEARPDAPVIARPPEPVSRPARPAEKTFRLKDDRAEGASTPPAALLWAGLAVAVVAGAVAVYAVARGDGVPRGTLDNVDLP